MRCAGRGEEARQQGATQSTDGAFGREQLLSAVSRIAGREILGRWGKRTFRRMSVRRVLHMLEMKGGSKGREFEPGMNVDDVHDQPAAAAAPGAARCSGG
jgi:hypothetical protein